LLLLDLVRLIVKQADAVHPIPSHSVTIAVPAPHPCTIDAMHAHTPHAFFFTSTKTMLGYAPVLLIPPEEEKEINASVIFNLRISVSPI
jgi:hypothetical protein